MSEINLFELGVERYFSFPKSYDKTRQQTKLEEMIKSGEYMYSLKTDGNWARFVIQDGVAELQTRGASKKTGKSHGEIQDKVFFFGSLCKAFSDDTVLLGEVYLDSGRDSDVGSILRCLPEKAIARQKEQKLKFRIFDILYYDGKSLLNTAAQSRVALLGEAVEKIADPLVSCVDYYHMTDSFYSRLEIIFENGGEGVVALKKNSIPEPSAKSARAWKTLKIKQELETEVDCFIIGVEPPERLYSGEHLEDWTLWQDMRTGEKIEGFWYDDYAKGTSRALEPISKNFYNNWPGAIVCGVFDDKGEIYPICKCAGLTDQMRTNLRDNYEGWHHTPVKLSAMQVSQNDRGRWSLRHPRLISVRTEDIDIKDCLLSKIID